MCARNKQGIVIDFINGIVIGFFINGILIDFINGIVIDFLIKENNQEYVEWTGVGWGVCYRTIWVWRPRGLCDTPVDRGRSVAAAPGAARRPRGCECRSNSPWTYIKR